MQTKILYTSAIIDYNTIHFLPQFHLLIVSYSIKEWNKLDHHTSQIESHLMFRNSLLRTIRPVAISIFDACDLLQ